MFCDNFGCDVIGTWLVLIRRLGEEPDLSRVPVVEHVLGGHRGVGGSAFLQLLHAERHLAAKDKEKFR